MRALFIAVFLIVCLAPVGAKAQVTVGTSACLITSTTPVVCQVAGGGKIVKVKNRSQTAQTATVTCTSGGQAVEEIGALGISQEIFFATSYYSGDPYAADLTCTASGAVNTGNPGDGIVIFTAPR